VNATILVQLLIAQAAEPAKGRILGMEPALFYCVVGVFAGGLIALVIALVVGASRKQAEGLKRQAAEQNRKLDALQQTVGQLTAYLDGLPQAKGPVRTSFDAGYAAYEACKWDEAIGHFKEALKTAQGTQLVALYNLIGLSHYTPGRRDDALAAFEESRRLAVDFKDRKGEAAALGNIGLIWMNKGEWDRAVGNLVQVLAVFGQLGAKVEVARTLRNLARCLEAMGREKFVAACVKAGMGKEVAEALVAKFEGEESGS